jgi:hypothetical protein
LRFGEAALAEPDVARALQLDAAFHRGFLAVRMGIRLSLALRASPRVQRPAAEDRDRAERDALKADPPERESLDSRHRPERAEAEERDRDREYEPVSLGKFLATLRGVADDARKLPAEARGDTLPTLEGLLARATAEAAPAPPDPTSRSTAGVSLLMKPPPAGGRALLLGSASPPLALRAALRPRPPPRGSG